MNRIACGRGRWRDAPAAVNANDRSKGGAWGGGAHTLLPSRPQSPSPPPRTKPATNPGDGAPPLYICLRLAFRRRYEPHSALPLGLPLVFATDSPLLPKTLRGRTHGLASSVCFQVSAHRVLLFMVA